MNFRSCLAKTGLWGALVACALPAVTLAQGLGSSDEEMRIEVVNIQILNPSVDQEVNKRIADQARATLAIFPFERFSRPLLQHALARVVQVAGIAEADFRVATGDQGGVVVDVLLDLSSKAEMAQPQGMAFNGWTDFPVIYRGDGKFATLKLESLGMYYGNANAWYGRPDLLLSGNPLVAGTPAGKGYKDWAEGFVHLGAYGIAPVGGNSYLYGGLSALASGSAGDELFTDRTRSHAAIEDAYVGVVGGQTDERGNRFAFNLAAGRKRFSLGDGSLLVNTAANGSERAALQSNPRWAADQLLQASFRYNSLKLEFFRVDPDELPSIDSKTVINGINIEARPLHGLDLAYSHLRVPKSAFGYFDAVGTAMSREGLRVHDIRLRWQPDPGSRSGLFLNAELAWQNHPRFAMKARASAVEGGWAFAHSAWKPVFSYRYARFSGDDPNTQTFERWDPLFSGGNGEQWVQGINHFKIVQNSNLVSHRFQLRLRPLPALELVPQFWIFRADSTTNLGGHQALSFLSGKDLGKELNLTAKLFLSRNTFIQGHVAVTSPGKAVKSVLGENHKPWWSTMLFIRHAY